MSELLELAEAYYTVANDLERRAQESLRVAATLQRMADELCEENMQQVAAPETVSPMQPDRESPMHTDSGDDAQ